MRISDWSSDVCSSDLHVGDERGGRDIARRLAPEQRGAEFGAGDFEDVEALFLQRNADDLELLAAAGRGQHQVAARTVGRRGAAQIRRASWRARCGSWV